MTREQIVLPDECENTFGHALVHIESAYAAAECDDKDQVLHDLGIAEAIIKNMRHVSSELLVAVQEYINWIDAHEVGVPAPTQIDEMLRAVVAKAEVQ